MMVVARYVHTNLIARDWRVLARFYETVFGCVPVPPERSYGAAEVEAGSGVPGAGLEGVHLRLPGVGPGGPTLEVFQYSHLVEAPAPVANRPGFGHIAFSVASVSDAHAEVLAHGGSPVGEIVDLVTNSGEGVRWCYVADPEGNILELQSWESARR